jgi:predicted 3-demethylubiquinone-9 3-methyltransferase (glyoxalase superfamily)
MQKITPFLWFDRQAEDAAKFYVSVFKKSRLGSIKRYRGAGAQAAGMPEGTAMTVSFTLEGQRFTALNAGPRFTFTEAISFVIHCKTQKEIDYYWNRLTADGGQESMCGWLKDKYGLSWQVVPDVLVALLGHKDSGKSQRAMQAMLQMRKIDIRTLREAADLKS